MSKTASLIPLIQILTKSNSWIDIKPTETYKQVTVKIWGKGVVERNEVTGAEISANTRLKVDAGQFILSRIDARHGAFGLIPESLAGAVVTNDFPVFSLNKSLIIPQFLNWISKTESFIELCKAASEGTTNRIRLKESKFLSMEISLPSLEEQRRIVGRIEELAGKIAEARGLRERSIEKTYLIRTSFYNNIFSKYEDKFVSIENLVGRANLKNGKSLRPDEQKSSIRCLRLSALRNGQIDCHDSKMVPMTEEEAEPYIVRYEDVFIVRGNGSKELIGQAGIIKKVLSNTIFPDLLIRVPIDPNQILPDFFVAWWNSPQMREKIIEAAKTTSGIWKINQGHIASFSVPVPSRSEQRRIVDYIREFESQIAAVQLLRQEALKELDALLPTILNKAFKGEL